MSLAWIVFVGFVAGLIARFLAPGRNNSTGIILTTVLGIAGAVLVTLLGQAIGWYHPGESTGLIGAVIGSLVVLFVWHRLVVNRIIRDPGVERDRP